MSISDGTANNRKGKESECSRPRLSVVVLTLNEAEHIQTVLDRVVNRSGITDPQVLIADGGSTDGTVEIARDYAPVIISPRGRARQMNAGLERAAGEVVLFLHGDTLLPDGYGTAILQQLEKSPVVAGSFRPVYRPAHPVLSLMSLVLQLPTAYLVFGDQAMFARRDLLVAMGGVPERPLMEDVALALALREQGKLIRLSDRVITSSRRFLERGVLRQLFLDLRLLFQYHILGIPARQLAGRYLVSSRDQPLSGEISGCLAGVMAKAPFPGAVKTRLGDDLGSRRSAEIYREMLDGLLERLEELPAGAGGMILAAGEADQKWFHEHHPDWPVHLQIGDSLGERLSNACRELLRGGAGKVLLLAADVPDLGCEEITAACQALDEVDLVLGPTQDGGYYLIGQRKHYPSLYEHIEWGGPRVYRQTLQEAKKLDLAIRELPELLDIDTLEDWKHFQARRGAQQRKPQEERWIR